MHAKIEFDALEKMSAAQNEEIRNNIKIIGEIE